MQTRALVSALVCVTVATVSAASAQNLALDKPATGSTACNTSGGPAKAFNGSVTGG
jgi:hypothetical protein